MATGAYPIPLYRSAVDGVVPPTGYDRRIFASRRPISAFVCPLIPSVPFRPAHVAPTNSNRAPLLRSSTGYLLQQVPHPRVLPSASVSLRPTNLRWDPAMHIVDSKGQPLASSRMNNTGIRLLRSESLQLTNSYSAANPRMISRVKVDARHFCGLQPIYENKPVAREVPSFRAPLPISR